MYKRALLLIVVIAFLQPVFGQSPVVKTYAYVRDVLPGIRQVKTSIDDTNPEAEKVTPKKEYYFFVESAKDTPALTCRAIWINKIRYSIISQEAKKTPVMDYTLPGSNNAPVELVPATNNYVYRIWHGKKSAVQKTKSSTLNKLRLYNQVVFEMTSNKKVYYFRVKKMKILETFSGA